MGDEIVLRLYSALIFLSLIWGLSFVFIKWMVEPAGIWGTTFLRCLAGALILLPLFYRQQKKASGKPLKWKPLIIVGLFNAGVPWTLIALSETQINSNTASILNATTPIWTGLIGFIVFSVMLTRFQWAGIAVGFFGILILMDFQVGGLFTSNFVGVGTMLIASMSYAFSSQYTKKALTGVSVVVISTFQLVVGGLVGLIGMFIQGGVDWNGLIDPKALLAIVGLGCFGSGIATLLFFYIVKKGSPEFASTVTYLIPGTAMVWGFFLLDEPVTSNLIIGLLIIFLGVFLSSRKSKKQLKAAVGLEGQGSTATQYEHKS
jgi:drug/metabolite transporter (DMT)-like permease